MRMEPLHGHPPPTLVRLLDDPEEHDFPSPRRAADPSTYDEPFENWPAVTPGEWPAARDEFFRVLQSLVELASRENELSRTLCREASGEPAWTVGYKLALSVAKHNAYHLGQIVVVRRVLGLWSQ